MLLVFFVLTGCAEVASELPLTHATATKVTAPVANVSDASRLGPPTPQRASARHLDRAAATTTAGIY